MYSLKGISLRKYQATIIDNAVKNNTLVVLPTGLGKTLIALSLSINRLNNYPESKVLMVAPTKPLCGQHYETFCKHTNVNNEQIVLINGTIKPKTRRILWNHAKIIIATPQTVEKDRINQNIRLNDVSLIIVDEAHHSKSKYANTKLAQFLIEDSNYPLILALTASPGGTKDKINEICDNLHIEQVEIKTEDDPEVQEYLKEKSFLWKKIDLPEEILNLSALVKDLYYNKLKSLHNLGYTKPIKLINKKDLLTLQAHFRKEIARKNKIAYTGISVVAQALKLSYLIDLIETQSILAAKTFIEKIKKDNTRASSIIVKDKNIKQLENKINDFLEKNQEHPKISLIKEIFLDEFKINSNCKAIVFANYRATVNEIYNTLKILPGCRPVRLIGQKEGLSQKEQNQVIKEFEDGKFNIIIGTSISEEGLNIVNCDIAIFYDMVASEIRKIQRGGRVGRFTKGKIFFLMASNTRDEANYWSASKKEKIMKKTLQQMHDVNLKFRT